MFACREGCVVLQSKSFLSFTLKCTVKQEETKFRVEMLTTTVERNS